MDTEKEENSKKIAKFAYTKVLSYAASVTEFSNFYKYLPLVSNAWSRNFVRKEMNNFTNYLKCEFRRKNPF